MAASADVERPLVDHLRELRDRLIKAVAALFVATILGWLLFDPVMDVVMGPACNLEVVSLGLDTTGQDCRLLVFKPLEAFSIRIRVSLLVGLVIAGPVLFWQLWRFITPGLTTRERRLTLPFILSSQVMFVAGVAFAYLVIPRGLDILLQMGGDNFVAALSGMEYLSFFLRTSLAFGLVFEVPVVLVFLSLLGLVGTEGMRRARPYAVVVNFAVAAMVTPTTDPVTLFAMAVPMVVFYELAILCAWLIERSRRRKGQVA